MNKFKILDSKWFHAGFDCIGIIVGINPDKEMKSYIAKVAGKDMKADEQYVATHGARFPIIAAAAIFPYLFSENEKSNP